MSIDVCEAIEFIKGRVNVIGATADTQVNVPGAKALSRFSSLKHYSPDAEEAAVIKFKMENGARLNLNDIAWIRRQIISIEQELRDPETVATPPLHAELVNVKKDFELLLKLDKENK